MKSTSVAFLLSALVSSATHASSPDSAGAEPTVQTGGRTSTTQVQGAERKLHLLVVIGALGGVSLATERYTTSDLRFINEVGIELRDAWPSSGPQRRRGLTIYGAAGDSDYRLGLKPYLRYDWRSHLSASVGLGVLQVPNNGDVGLLGTASAGYRDLLLRSDLHVIPDSEGTEVVLYGGAAARDKTAAVLTLATGVFVLAYSIAWHSGS